MVDRVYERSAAQGAPQPPLVPSIGYPTNGNPAQGVAATIPGAYWYYMMTECLRQLVVDSGRNPDHLDLSLVSKAVLQYVDVAEPQTEYRMVMRTGIPMMEEI